MYARFAVSGAATLAAFLVATASGSAGGGPGGGYSGYGPYAREARAFQWCNTGKKDGARQRACLIDQAVRLLIRTGDPADEMPRIDRYAQRTGGYLYANCHILFHTVGRRYGRAVQLTLARLKNYLPHTNNPGCSAGFAHGMITYLGPQIVQIGPKGAVRQCDEAATRYERYSCIHGLGHAYMRLFGESLHLALGWCRALGPENAVDCAQGAYHDYWISLSGYDNTRPPPHAKTSPRAVCDSQPAGFVRACWYRAFLERPPRHTPRSAADLHAVCDGLRGLDLEGCITAASLITSTDATRQMAICAHLRGRLAVDCVRGVRVQSLAGAPIGIQVAFIRLCSGFDPSARSGCYRWIGKTLNVVRNGGFGFRGCRLVRSADGRAACYRGARSYRGPLETFS